MHSPPYSAPADVSTLRIHFIDFKHSLVSLTPSHPVHLFALQLSILDKILLTWRRLLQTVTLIVRHPSSHLYPATSLQFTCFFLEHKTCFGSFRLHYSFYTIMSEMNWKASGVTWQLKPVTLHMSVYIPLLSLGSVPVCTINTTFLYLVSTVDFFFLFWNIQFFIFLL